MTTIPDLLDVATRLANLEQYTTALEQRVVEAEKLARRAQIDALNALSKVLPPVKPSTEESPVPQPGLF